MNYYQESLNKLNAAIGASNWPRDLDAARRGEGDFGVPMPSPIMTRSELLINLNRAQVLKNQVQSMIDNTHQDPWDLIPMQSIVTILSQTVYAYQVRIAEMNKEEIPTQPIEPAPQIPQTPVEEQKTGIMEWIKANPIPVVIGGFLLLNFVILPKNKRLIKF